MSTKRFCDVCHYEILSGVSVTSARVRGELIIAGQWVNLEVTCGVGTKGSYNSGDLCGDCLFRALEQLDPRPKAAPSE